MLQDDERRMVSRQMNGTSEQAGTGLWKQGSVGLPAPDESGFPAHHPDMCIVRVRRNHLLEVSWRTSLWLNAINAGFEALSQGHGSERGWSLVRECHPTWWGAVRLLVVSLCQ